MISLCVWMDISGYEGSVATKMCIKVHVGTIRMVLNEILQSLYINHVILLSLYIQCTVRSHPKKQKKKHLYLHDYMRQ